MASFPQSFSDWITALLRHLQLPLPQGAAQPYTTFFFDGKPNVYVTGQDGQVDYMSEAGMLSVPFASDMLLSLLALNRINGADDPVSVTVDRVNGAVIVWARQRQQALVMEDAARLLQLVRQKVDMVQQLLGYTEQCTTGQAVTSLARLLQKQAVSGR